MDFAKILWNLVIVVEFWIIKKVANLEVLFILFIF